MGINIAGQTISFFQACLLGAVLGILYDVFRILRVAFPAGKGAVFVQDIIFWFLCSVVTFLFLLSSVDGVIRMFLIIGEIIGGVLYHMTIGVVVMKISETIIGAIKAVLNFVIKYLFLPIWRLVFNIVAFILRPFRFLLKFMGKSLQRLCFSLKLRRVVLYNQFTGYLHKRSISKKVGETQPNEAQEKP